jgi:hypothetical protein
MSRRRAIRRRDMDPDEYLRLVRAYNRQREKTADERVREELLDVEPEAVEALMDLREKQVNRPLHNGLVPLEIEGCKRRWKISGDKADHVEHIKRVVAKYQSLWPLTDRGVHYRLLNYDFLRNRKQELLYVNDDKCYKATANLLTRLRLDGTLPWACLADPTRPVKEYIAYDNVREFIKTEVEEYLLVGYWRNLLQSQPNYLEVLCEKNTIYHVAQQVTERYQITTRSARGINCIDSLHDMAVAFRKSGKKYFDLITLSDQDPEGCFIPHDAGRRLRDDFGISTVRIFPAAVTREQIERLGLQSNNTAKEKSSHYEWFVERNDGDDTTWELEAMEPENLQADLDHVIRSVIETDLFNKEVATEKEELKAVARTRQVAVKAIKAAEVLYGGTDVTAD